MIRETEETACAPAAGERVGDRIIRILLSEVTAPLA